MNSPSSTKFIGSSSSHEGFKVYKIHDGFNIPIHSRKDYYRISVIIKKVENDIVEERMEEVSALIFCNPSSHKILAFDSGNHYGYVCLFTKHFITTQTFLGMLLEDSATFPLNARQKQFFVAFFEKMIIEQDTFYAFKDDLIRNFIILIMHEVLKCQNGI